MATLTAPQLVPTTEEKENVHARQYSAKKGARKPAMTFHDVSNTFNSKHVPSSPDLAPSPPLSPPTQQELTETLFAAPAVSAYPSSYEQHPSPSPPAYADTPCAQVMGSPRIEPITDGIYELSRFSSQLNRSVHVLCQARRGKSMVGRREETVDATRVFKIGKSLRVRKVRAGGVSRPNRARGVNLLFLIP
eukprot:comp19718_c0_seq1/m.23475 comp19718_c0_seq1/g.23475  ORF comp19718_c0_seq1/g.23475 comp19718_c0_seq1/m.23475 type:complete len:191 (-) comp19718_c0_seq1:575-1147(-)